ncbi:hypothetical protein A3G69_03115 [Candidatus Peribacteria bacterium RIFCSPLOWO2_12_FULL_53_10]|nr:MAG: hypothetical protein A3G69_03115 [Candidatus Peribacteria bacterium RIFCSPLOWO2_12_FULL_53_10]
MGSPEKPHTCSRTAAHASPTVADREAQSEQIAWGEVVMGRNKEKPDLRMLRVDMMSTRSGVGSQGMTPVGVCVDLTGGLGEAPVLGESPPF